MNWKTFKVYFKIFFRGHPDYIKKGYAMIPCKKCNEIFKSFPHYKRMGTYDIDTRCKECKKQ